MVVAGPEKSILEWALGSFEHGLVGGETGEPPLDLQGDVLEDVGRVVGLPVDVVDDLFRLDPRPVGATLEVEEHVQEVGDFEVGLDLQAKSVAPEDLPHPLASLLHLPGAEGADTEEVVPVEASLDGKMGQLRQQKHAN